MSVLGIAAAAAGQANTMRKVDFAGPARKKPSDAKASAIGALPVGSGNKLLANAVQSLGQAAAQAEPATALGGRVNLTA
jgi:hypothetical protein